jgi:iron(III) transport system permease protein
MGWADQPETVGEQPTGRRVRRALPTLLGAVAFAIALLVLSPLVWLFLQAGAIPFDRGLSLLTSGTTLTVTINTIVLVSVVTLASVLLGVPLAFLTVQTDLPFRRFFTITSALPLVVPSYIGAFAFVSAFGPHGELAALLSPLGIERVPTIYGLPGAVLVLTFFTYPYVFLTTRASLLSFDGSVVEAARSLNHTRWEAFRRVTLPQITPGIAAGALLVALYVLADFGTPAIMKYDVFTRMIYNEFNARRQDFAAVLSLLLLVMALAILAIQSRIEADRDGAYVNRGSQRPGIVRLGRWRYPAVAFAGGVALLCLVLPVAIIAQRLLRGGQGYAAGGFAFELGYAWNSVLLAGAAAAVCVVLALPVAYFATRGTGTLAILPDRLTYVGYAVPGVVLGLALVYLGLSYVPFLYGSVIVLVFAYVVRFLPQAVGSSRSSLLQVDPHYVEAARSLGYSPLSAFRRVVLPIVAPGVVAGAALVFLTTMKELPATLMLRPPGFETFVTFIWIVQDAGYYGQAAVPALVLVGVSGLSMLVILGRERYDVME